MSNDRIKPAASLTPAIYSWDLQHIQRFAELAGYAIAVHGSMNRDFDLIAVPWVEWAFPPSNLVETICRHMNLTMQQGDPAERPHKRLTYTLLMDGDRFIDLSIIKPWTLDDKEVEGE